MKLSSTYFNLEKNKLIDKTHVYSISEARVYKNIDSNFLFYSILEITQHMLTNHLDHNIL